MYSVSRGIRKEMVCQNKMFLYHFSFLLVAQMITVLHSTLSLFLSRAFPLSTSSFAGSLHHHQGLSTPCRAESGLAVLLPALLRSETPDAQRGVRQSAQSASPSDFYHTGDRIPFIPGDAASWVAVTASATRGIGVCFRRTITKVGLWGCFNSKGKFTVPWLGLVIYNSTVDWHNEFRCTVGVVCALQQREIALMHRTIFMSLYWCACMHVCVWRAWMVAFAFQWTFLNFFFKAEHHHLTCCHL